MIIHEIASKRIIPPLKGIIIHRLYKNGYSQRKIASLFSITQPQIHKYLSKPIEKYNQLLEGYGLNIDEVNRLVDLLIDLISKNERERFIIVLSSIADYLARKYVCIHYTLYREYCSRGRVIDPFIVEYENTLKKILSLRKIHRLIPEVGSNIAYAPHTAHSVFDVIGLPGRIIRIGDRVIAVGEPIYGGSKHTASILILAQKYDHGKHVVMNIKYIGEISDLIGGEYSVIKCGPHKASNFWSDIEECLTHKPDILCDKGGEGLEPITYLIVPSLNELLTLLEKILLVTV